MLTKLKDCWLVLTGRLSSEFCRLQNDQAQFNYNRLLEENNRIHRLWKQDREQLQRYKDWDPVDGKARREDSDRIARAALQNMMGGAHGKESRSFLFCQKCGQGTQHINGMCEVCDL